VSEFDDKLNTLLSNPESMAQIMQLAQSLSGQSAPSSEPAAQSAAAPPPPPSPPPQPNAEPPFSVPGGFDPKLLTKLMPVLQELGTGKNSDAARLLFALKPYLKEERQAKVERALQLARVIHIGKKFLTSGEG
jgi:hypothetical protein